MNFGVNLLPVSNKSNSLGSSSKKWNDIYTDKINGQSLDGASAYGEVGPVPIAAISDALSLNAAKLLVDIEPVQAGSGDPSPDNVRPITGWTGANVVVSPTTDAQDGTTYPISWQSEAGTVYGGSLDVTTGLLTVTMAEVDLGTLNWSRYLFSSQYAFYTNITGRKSKSANTICSTYPVVDDGPQIMPDKTLNSTANSTYIYIRDDTYTDAATFKAAMSGVQLVYELANPITYQLTPQQVALLQGQNNIWADCGNTAVGYWRDDSLSINKAISERMPDITPLQSGLAATQSGIAIIVSGDTASMAVPVGGYAYIKNNTHGLAEGLYTNTSSAAFPTVGGTADRTVFTGVSGGSLNALNASLTYTDFNINLTNTDLITVNTNIDGNKIVAFEFVYTDSLWHAVIKDKREITTSLIDDGRIAIFQNGGTKTTDRAIVIRVWHKRI